MMQSGSSHGTCTKTVPTNPRSGFAPNTLPESRKPAQAETTRRGVSTQYVPTPNVAHWYALRTTYGREMRAYDYLTAHDVTAFCPTLRVVKLVRGKRKRVEESRIPNILFAYGKFEDIKAFVYDNVNLPYLRFYYRYFHHPDGSAGKEPVIVPESQMEGLRIICSAEGQDIIVAADVVHKFLKGESVRVKEGTFAGVTGRVARYQGQQRVGIVINGLLTATTAYIPTAFLEKVEDIEQ